LATTSFFNSLNRSLGFSGSPISLFINKHIGLILFVFFLSLHGAVYSQEEQPPKVPNPEKIYLQLSSKVFASGQPIWFKAIVLDAKSNVPSGLSGLLYVDLIGMNGEILLHKLVKLKQGIGEGALELGDSYPAGRYLIRAYTKWNANFSENFMFSSYVNMVSVNGNPNKHPEDNLTIAEDNGFLKLKGLLKFKETEENPDRRIKVYLDWGKGQDTISVKKNKDGDYPLNYDLTKKQSRVSVSMDIGENLQYSTTVFLNDQLPDLQFFPESGQLVHGLSSRVAVKAIGPDGKGIKVEGVVVDRQGKKVTNFKSNALGMGVFFLQADSLSMYQAKVFLPNAKEPFAVYSLPRVMAQGAVLNVFKNNKKIRLALTSNSLTDSVYIKASCRGVDYFLIAGKLKNKQLVVSLPDHQLPEGIIAFKVENHDRQPIVERLFYNVNHEQKLIVSSNFDQESYKQREPTNVNIKISGNKSAAEASNISIMVFNGEAGKLKSENILSYFLLSSELKGEIENPGYYFNEENSDRLEDLDALMLTQGWRSYKYPVQRKKNVALIPEQGLSLKGVVMPPLLGKKNGASNVDLTLATFGNETTIYSQTTDSLGNFFFQMDDAYGKRIRILLKAMGKHGRNRNFSFSLDSAKTPKIFLKNYSLSKEEGHTINQAVRLGKKRVQAEQRFDMLNGFNDLEEVVVEDYLLSPEMEAAHKSFGLPDVIIPGAILREKEEKWSYGLYSILMFNYSDQVWVEQFPDGFMLAHIIGGKDEPTLLAIDGELLEKDQYELVPYMPPGIVEQVELIKHAKFFKKQYLRVFPETNPLDAPYMGHIISVYTKDGVGILGSEKPAPGTLDTSMQVISPVKEFYSPKYSSTDSLTNRRPDFRSLVHWDANLTVDDEGSTSVEFFNGDVIGEHVLVIEAIANDGRIGYEEKTYRVIP